MTSREKTALAVAASFCVTVLAVAMLVIKGIAYLLRTVPLEMWSLMFIVGVSGFIVSVKHYAKNYSDKSTRR